jgi:hypothetical protein
MHRIERTAAGARSAGGGFSSVSLFPQVTT